MATILLEDNFVGHYTIMKWLRDNGYPAINGDYILNATRTYRCYQVWSKDEFANEEIELPSPPKNIDQWNGVTDGMRWWHLGYGWMVYSVDGNIYYASIY